MPISLTYFQQGSIGSHWYGAQRLGAHIQKTIVNLNMHIWKKALSIYVKFQGLGSGNITEEVLK